ncbi:caspase family protein [Flagellimonas sp. 2504JD4-2]
MKKALIIGINDYPSHPLKGAVNDATGISKLLKVNGDKDNSTNFEIDMVLNPKSKGDLLTKISNFFSRNADMGLLYFAGHGYVNELGGFIVTPDHQRYDEGISMDNILNFVNNSPISNKIIILDCCKSGKFADPAQNTSVTAISSGTTILTSSRKDEPSKEINGRGVFTNLLIEGLKGGAADIRGHISPGGLYAYIDQALSAHEQRPVFKTNVTEFVKLRTIVSQVPLGTLRKITEYFPEPLSNYELNPSYEDTNNPNSKITIKTPYSEKENVSVFKDLQKLQSVGLVVPVDEQYMYFAAMNSKSCKLTPLGHHYWRLVNEGRI